MNRLRRKGGNEETTNSLAKEIRTQVNPPNMPIVYSRQEAKEAIEKAEFVFKTIKDRVEV